MGTLRPTGRSDLRGRRSQAIADTADQRLPFGGPGSACRPMVAASSGGGGISADPPAECPVRHSMRPRPARSVPAPFQDDLDAASLIFPVPSGDCPGYPSSWSPVRPKYAGWLCSSRSSVRGSDLKPWRYVRHASRRARARTRVRQCAVFAFRCVVLATSAAACSLAPLRKGLGDVPGTPCNSVGVIFPKLPAMFLKLLASCASLGSANKIKHLLQNCQLVSNNCPINVYGQAWTLITTMPYARCAGDCRRICTGQRCADKYPTLGRAEIPTQHIFGVFNGRDAGPG